MRRVINQVSVVLSLSKHKTIKMSNRHGGKRTNAGRLSNNQSHGRPVSRGGLTSFGFTGRSRQHNAFPNDDDEEQPPLENNQETNEST